LNNHLQRAIVGFGICFFVIWIIIYGFGVHFCGFRKNHDKTCILKIQVLPLTVIYEKKTLLNAEYCYF